MRCGDGQGIQPAHAGIHDAYRIMNADVRITIGAGEAMQSSQNVGGSGGGSSQSQPTTRDVCLAERAIRESWDLPEDTRRAMLARLGP